MSTYQAYMDHHKTYRIDLNDYKERSRANMEAPKSTAAWILNSQDGPPSLEFKDDLPLSLLQPGEVLVKLHAASLNAREAMIAKGVAGLKLGHKDLVPGSDGAGIVVAVSSGSGSFQEGDWVCTHLTRGIEKDEQPWLKDVSEGLGQKFDGTLRQYGVFHISSLVQMPGNLSFLEAATLTCSALTAWNALFGIVTKAPNPKRTVVVQGTGGVSIAALQFALAAGATVIATTSSTAKAERLIALGAHHVLNYRDKPDWGAGAKALTPDGKGAHIIVDVGGNSTLRQSLNAIRAGGLIAATGVLGDAPDGKPPAMLDCVWTGCIVRGIVLGTRDQFDQMNKYIEKHNIKPVLDDRVFGMKEVKEAYEFLIEQKHFSKIGIRIC